MTDTNKPGGDTTLSVTPTSKTLTLSGKPGAPQTVRQNFSHGRSKAVVVEVTKKRVIPPVGGAKPAVAAPVAPAPVQAPPTTPAAAPKPPVAPPITVARPATPAPAPTPTPVPTPEPVKVEAPVARAPEPAPVPTPAPVVEAKVAVPPAPVVAPVVEAPPPVAAQPVPPPKPATVAKAPEVRSAPVAPAAPQARPGQATPPPRGGQQARPGAPSGPSGRGPGPGGRDDRRGSGPGGQRPGAPQARPGGSGMVLRELTREEQEFRSRILLDAKAREEEDRRRAVEEGRRRQELEDAQRREREAAEARRREEEERHRREQEAKQRAEAEARRRLGDEAAAAAAPRPPGARAPGATARPGVGARPAGGAPRPGDPSATPSTTPRPPGLPGVRRPADDEDDDLRRRASGPGGIRKGPPRAAPARPEKREADRRLGRLTLTNALDENDERARSVAAMRRRVQRNQRRMMGDQPREKIMREVVIPETISIQELSNRMSERAVDIIRFLMRQGQLHKITDVIDGDTAELIASEFGHTPKRVSDSDVEEGLFTSADDVDDMEARPPVVTIMGHVDHGKTSLLDALRRTNVVAGEAGGITQHIGAYQVVAPGGGRITFIDTPGHAAFTAMRARGAKVTDIVVLVVAADDGVMPQTVEAIQHAKAAKVPLIVAINKIDKPDAKPDRVKTELLQHDIQVESMGGETLEIEVSATKKLNLDKLLDAIQLQSEVLELKAAPHRPAEAIVVEAKLDKGRGPVASAIVQRGTLKVGDIVVAGSAWGRVRALIGDDGSNVAEAGPSVPVEILGFDGVPEAGDRLAVVENEARAREIADFRERKRREKALARAAGARTSLADMMSQLKSGAGKKELMLVVKSDVQGSGEAIAGALEKLGNDEVGARLLSQGVGGITESDVTLAAASKAVIIGFNVRASREAREAAERDGIEIRYYNIIYNLVDDVKQAMTGLLAPTYREEMLGNALILEVFNITKVGKVAGCRVTDGKVERGAGVRLIRDNVVIHEGKLSQLKRFKDDAKEVTTGMDCGMAFENYQDMRQGDIIECYRVVEVARTL